MAAAAAASSSSTTRRPFRDLSLRHKAFFSKPSSFGVSFPPHSRPKAALLRFSSSSSSSSQVTSSCHPKADVVTKDMWDKSILNSELPVLVEFYASWCGPCGMVQRVMDEIAEEYAGKVRCFILNTDHDLQVAEDYAIKAVPVVMLFKNGKRCDSVIGTMPKDYYVAAINRIMES